MSPWSHSRFFPLTVGLLGSWSISTISSQDKLDMCTRDVLSSWYLGSLWSYSSSWTIKWSIYWPKNSRLCCKTTWKTNKLWSGGLSPPGMVIRPRSLNLSPPFSPMVWASNAAPLDGDRPHFPYHEGIKYEADRTLLLICFVGLEFVSCWFVVGSNFQEWILSWFCNLSILITKSDIKWKIWTLLILEFEIRFSWWKILWSIWYAFLPSSHHLILCFSVIPIDKDPSFTNPLVLPFTSSPHYLFLAFLEFHDPISLLKWHRPSIPFDYQPASLVSNTHLYFF